MRSRPSSSRPRGAHRGALALALSALGACGQPAGPTMVLRDVRAVLVAEPERCRTLREPAQGSVEARIVRALRGLDGDHSLLPALVVPPGGEVHVDLAGLPTGCELDFGVGFDERAHAAAAGGRVRFELERSGMQPWSLELDYGPEVPRRDWGWKGARLELGDCRTVVLRTRALAGGEGVSSAFARLHVVARRERPRTRASARRPNVVLIVVDTLRADRVGGDRGLTPRLDRLAAGGLVYERAYSAAPWTWPSTASLMTGLPPPRHGVQDSDSCFLAQELVTLAEVLQAAGWTTVAHSVNPLIRAERDFDQGFERFDCSNWESAEHVVDAVITDLDALAAQRFLLYLHLGDPHEYRPAPDLRERWAGAEPEGYDLAALRQELSAMRAGEEHDAQRAADIVAYRSKLYDATVAQVDRELGRLLDALAAHGLEGKTLLAFTSDHGEEFLEHGLVGHSKQLFRESVCVPLILSGPGVPGGTRIDSPVENRRLAATLLELVGAEHPDFDDPLPLDAASARADARPILLSTLRGRWPLSAGSGVLDVGGLHGIRTGERLLVWAPSGGAEREELVASFSGPAELPEELDATERAPLVRAIAEWLESGARQRPRVLGGGEEVVDLLRALGYVDQDR